MYPRTYLALGVLLGTLLGYALSKKKDMRIGLSVGIGAAGHGLLISRRQDVYRCFEFIG